MALFHWQTRNRPLPPPSLWRQSDSLLDLSLLLGLGSLIAWFLFAFTVDDTFISMRYAENLVEGNGLVFNNGERVEGYSNFSWVLVLALLHLPPWDTLIAAKLLGLVTHLLCGLVMLRIASEQSWSRLWTLGGYLATLPLALWGVSGMETSLYTLVLLLSLRELLFHPSKPRRALPWLLLLLLLSRPEAPILVAIILFWALQWRCLTLRQLAWPGTLVTALLAARFFYYGDLLPNTYYAKDYQTLARYPITIYNYVGSWFLRLGWIPSLVALAAVLTSGNHRNGAFMLLSVAAGQLAFTVHVGGDWMPGWRFLVPVMPAIILAGASIRVPRRRSAQVPGSPRAAIRWAAESASIELPFGLPRLSAPARQLLFAVLLTAYGALNIAWANDIVPWRWRMHTPTSLRLATANFNPNYQAVVDWLYRRGLQGESAAIGELGFICYYTELHCLDLHGLTDPRIAKSDEFPNTVIGKKLPLRDTDFYRSDVGRYILERRPRLLILSTEESGDKPLLMGAAYALEAELGNFRIYSRLQ